MKKIFVAGNDVELRMLFADYEHGTDVRKKIVEVQTVHPHVTEEEAFLALAPVLPLAKHPPCQQGLKPCLANRSRLQGHAIMTNWSRNACAP